MKYILTIGIMVAGWWVEASAHRMLPLGTVVRFASEEKGRELLSTMDSYTAKWSPFDIQSRLQDKEGSIDALLEFAGDQVLPWTVEEEQRIRVILGRIDSAIRVNNYYWPLPKEIFLVKSTLLEEGGAGGYTRANYIVLRQDVIFRDEAELQRIVLHELFHILTRHSPDYRQKFYSCIGFTVRQPIEFPASMQELRLTNPDAHSLDSYISLTGTDSTEFDAVMIIYARQAWKGGLFFQYLRVGFLEVELDENGMHAVVTDDGPVVRNVDEVLDFFSQVGRNTQYIIDPEEILADNFADLLRGRSDLPDPWVTERIGEVLRRH